MGSKFIDRLFWMGKEYEDICVSSKCSSEGDFNKEWLLIINDCISYSVDTIQPPFSTHF